MTAKDAILFTYATAERFTKAYLAELTAADLMVRPVPGQNHIAWQLGHLIVTERNLVEGVKPGSSPELPEGFLDGHGRDKPKLDDPSKCLATEDYIRLMDAQRAATKAALASLDDAALDAPAPESMRRMAQTVGEVFTLAGGHWLIHLGQFVAVRRKLDKAIAI